MEIVKNLLLDDQHGRPVVTDIFYDEHAGKRPVVIYAHGFNGFKDWGNFDLIAAQFARAGFTFVKFNFAWNGTTPAQPEDFADLDAYGNNNYTKEMDNLGTVIDWVADERNPYSHYIDTSQIALLGHSRGGGIVLLKAAEDDRVKAVVTWASVSECKTPWGSWTREKLAEWNKNGVAFITNSRTKQELPLYYQLYEDYQLHEGRLNIEKNIKKLHIPVLICHGLEDASVPAARAEQLKAWYPAAELFLTEGDHVFGRKHPWTESHLPQAMQTVVDRSILFFTNSVKA
jgi:dienelactone hydrolase